MTWRRVILYGALFGVALLYYWGSEPSKAPRPETSPNELTLVDMPLDRVTEVHLIRGGKRVRCGPEGGTWRVVDPPGRRVPVDLISTLVMTLVETRAAEVIAREATEYGPFGLGTDALRVELYQRGHDAPVTVILGNRNPTDTALYARVEGSPRVLLVGRILEYYIDRVFEEVEQHFERDAIPAVDIDQSDRRG
jgi:Domain of unknown function (DUF4340)